MYRIVAILVLLFVAISNSWMEDDINKLIARDPNNLNFILQSLTRAIKIDDDITKVTINHKILEQPEVGVTDNEEVRVTVKQYVVAVEKQKTVIFKWRQTSFRCYAGGFAYNPGR